jgi:S1-C subfamily serine protease
MDVSLPESMPLVRSRLVAARTIAASLIAAIVLGAGATMATAGQSASEPSLGSANEYVKNAPDSASPYEIPLLGIEVNNAVDSLKGGRQVSGVEFSRRFPVAPVRRRACKVVARGVQTALTVGILAGAVFFPPAMLGMIALQQSGIGISHELIIAVDGQRTRDVTDFGEAIEKAEAGEVVYLTVLSHGQREQLRVELPGQPR